MKPLELFDITITVTSEQRDVLVPLLAGYIDLVCRRRMVEELPPLPEAAKPPRPAAVEDQRSREQRSAYYLKGHGRKIIDAVIEFMERDRREYHYTEMGVVLDRFARKRNSISPLLSLMSQYGLVVRTTRGYYILAEQTDEGRGK